MDQVDREENKASTEQPGYTPASPGKRILAWVGVVYMVILLFLNFYALATGSPLQGLTGLLLAPACGGLTALMAYRWRKGQVRGSRAGALAVAVLAGAACAVNLVWGLLALAGQLGG